VPLHGDRWPPPAQLLLVAANLSGKKGEVTTGNCRGGILSRKKGGDLSPNCSKTGVVSDPFKREVIRRCFDFRIAGYVAALIQGFEFTFSCPPALPAFGVGSGARGASRSWPACAPVDGLHGRPGRDRPPRSGRRSRHWASLAAVPAAGATPGLYLPSPPKSLPALRPAVKGSRLG
jgi:hypothetical protein